MLESNESTHTNLSRLTRARRSMPVNLSKYEPIDNRQALVIEIGSQFTKLAFTVLEKLCPIIYSSVIY